MSSSAIDVRSISKQYGLGESGMMKLFGRSSKKFWALHDVSFEFVSTKPSASSAPMEPVKARC